MSNMNVRNADEAHEALAQALSSNDAHAVNEIWDTIQSWTIPQYELDKWKKLIDASSELLRKVGRRSGT